MNYSAFFTALLLLIVNGSSAQTKRDFFVTNQFDTVYGEFSGYSYFGNMRFKVDGKNYRLDPQAVYRVYDAKDNRWFAPSYIQDCIVRVEGSDPKIYKISERLRGITKPQFAQILTDGAIVVYSFTLTQNMAPMTGGILTTNNSLRTYALKRSTNEIVELRKTAPVLFFQVSSTKIKKDQSVFFADFPELLQEMAQQESISYDYMLECIKRYNEQREIMGEGLATYGTTIF